jgi:hypothetical protein
MIVSKEVSQRHFEKFLKKNMSDVEGEKTFWILEIILGVGNDPTTPFWG